jgi:UDPglucose--hexose-1-phosphate uridylyltransferase
MTVPALLPLHRRELTKPDGRKLWLYGRVPIDARIQPVAPPPEGASPNPHLVFHPLRGEWVISAHHRQGRTFLPPADYNPLARTVDGAPPTELPAGEYEVAVFENRFPSLCRTAHDAPASYVRTAPATGSCEVVVFTEDAKASLGSLSRSRIELIFEVWADRTRELGRRDDVAYVFPFENRGVEMGVTLQHPHGQIYAYPFVPPVPARELEMQRAHLEAHGQGLLAHVLEEERRDGRRLVADEGRALCFVPAFARYAYEVWVAPARAVESFAQLDAAELAALALVLKLTLLKLDRLFARPMPYLLAVHQAPTDGLPHPEAHLHLEIYPALRMKERLKYLAGSELGAGTFTADTDPAEKAAELRELEVSA